MFNSVYSLNSNKWKLVMCALNKWKVVQFFEKMLIEYMKSNVLT